MSAADYLTLFAMVSIWSLMAVNVFLTVGGFLYYSRMAKTDGGVKIDRYPMVSVLVPAHNEGAVIVHTVRALLALDYPEGLFEVIVVNDNSSDNSADLLAALEEELPGGRLIVINTDAETGGKGKPNALNIGLAAARGEVLAIYDADNTPEPKALRILVENLVADPSLGAVIGKFRTRNRDKTILTRFVNIETLAHQCTNQAGRWFFFGLCTIPGTNYAIRREIVERMGGWDEKALSEDTEISFRIYRMGYKIRFMPQAVTWEQEPATVGVWFRQRTRWAVGNIRVLAGNLRYVFDRSAGRMRLDVIYYLLLYVLMLTALVCSDAIFLLGILGFSRVSLGGLSSMVWVLASLLFVLNLSVTVAGEKNEFSASTVFLILLMLFSYCKLWVAVTARALYLTVKQAVTKIDVKWYKTERTED